MNLNGYIKKFGKYSFKERPFCDIDAAVLAELSMLSLEKYQDKDGKVRLGDLDISVVTKDKKVVYDSPTRRANNEQLKAMIKSKRYSGLILKDFEREFSVREMNQFYAVTILLPNRRFYVSFRGTDISLIGWREDFLLVTDDAFMAQKQAKKYLLKALKNNIGKVYIGGHSKGGNIAAYSALHLDRKQASRVINVFSFDGPGLRKPVEKYPGYKYIFNKIKKFRTYNNMIGSMYNQVQNSTIVHSTGLLFGGHDIYYWQINGITGEFMTAKDVSPFSKKFMARFHAWIDSLTIKDRELACDALFDVFKHCKNVYDLPTKGLRDIANYKKNLSKYKEEDQERLKEIFGALFKHLFNISDKKQLAKN